MEEVTDFQESGRERNNLKLRAISNAAEVAAIRKVADEGLSMVTAAKNYGQAGAIQFYGHCFVLPDPVSFSDNYLLSPPSIDVYCHCQ